MSDATATGTITGRMVSGIADPEERFNEPDVAWGQFDSKKKQRQRVERWQHLIDSRLIEWGRNPSMLEDDGVDAPSPRTIANACQLARKMRNDKLPPPTRIVPTPDGGVSFELETGDQLICLEVTPAGTIEYDRFVNSRLVDHMELPQIGRVVNR